MQRELGSLAGAFSLPSHLESSYVLELFCDAFATFAMGPSYPLAYASYEALPRGWFSGDSRPDGATRVELCVAVLRAAGVDDQRLPAILIDRLEEFLAGIADPATELLPSLDRRARDDLAHGLYGVLSSEMPAVRFDARASGAPGLAGLAGHLDEPPRGTTIRAVLNAGWLARLGGAQRGVGAKVRGAVLQLAREYEIRSPLPPR